MGRWHYDRSSGREGKPSSGASGPAGPAQGPQPAAVQPGPLPHRLFHCDSFRRRHSSRHCLLPQVRLATKAVPQRRPAVWHRIL